MKKNVCESYLTSKITIKQGYLQNRMHFFYPYHVPSPSPKKGKYEQHK